MRTISRTGIIHQMGPSQIEPDTRFVVSWLADDRQSDMWMGVGATEEAAIADARAKMEKSGTVGGTMEVYQIIDDEDQS